LGRRAFEAGEEVGEEVGEDVSDGVSGTRLVFRPPRLRRRRAGAGAASWGIGAWWWSASRVVRCGAAVGASDGAGATAMAADDVSASARFGSFDFLLKNSRGIRFLSTTVSACAVPAAVPAATERLVWVARDNGYQRVRKATDHGRRRQQSNRCSGKASATSHKQLMGTITQSKGRRSGPRGR
jgi:hypothetical protein